MSESGTDPVAALLRLVGEHRDSIREQLDHAQLELLLTRLRGLADASPEDEMAVRRALQGVRLALLPLPFDHPVRRALDTVRLTATPVGPQTVAQAGASLAALADPTPDPTPDPDPDHDAGTIIATVERELLRMPSLSAAEVRLRFGGGAPPPELIRLTDPERGDRYPEFQFVPDLGPAYEIVLEVNRVLLADVDPWGAADWWLGGNTWLGRPPVSLLGELSDRQLMVAARALVEAE